MGNATDMSTFDGDLRNQDLRTYSQVQHAICNNNVDKVVTIINEFDRSATRRFFRYVCDDLDRELTGAFARMLALAYDPDVDRAHARARSLGLFLDRTRIQDLDPVLTQALEQVRLLKRIENPLNDLDRVLIHAHELSRILARISTLNHELERAFDLVYIRLAADVLVRMSSRLV